MDNIKLPDPRGTAVVLGIASVVAGGVKGFYDSKHGGIDCSVVGYGAAVQGVAGGFYGYLMSGLGGSLFSGVKPSKKVITLFTGLGVVAGATKGSLETTVGYVFGYGLGKLV